MPNRKRTLWRLLSLGLALALLAAACASDDGAADTADAALAEAGAANSEADAALADAQAASAQAEAALRAAEAAAAAAELAQATAEGNQEAVAAAEAALADAQDAAAAARDEAASAQAEADAARDAAAEAESQAAAAAAAAEAASEPEPMDDEEPMDDMAPPALVDKPEGWTPPEASMGTAIAWPSGPAVELPQLTIGYLQVLGASEAAQRLELTAKDAVDYLGWGWEYCDAEGVPDAMQTCLEGFINSGVDAIVTDGTTVEVIVEGLARARDAGIPFVNTGGTQSFYHLYAASFNPNDAALGRVLAEWMMDNRGKDGPVQISSAGFAKWGSDREDQLRAAVEGTDVTIGAVEMVDFADVIGTAADLAANWLLQAPDSLAFWLTFDLAALGVGPVITESFSGVSPPDRPMVLTFYANCTTQQQMQAGGVDASSEENLEWGSYVAMDQIASYYAKGVQFTDELRPYYEDADGNAWQFSIPFIVTPEDVGDECNPGRGPYPTPTDSRWTDYVDFFEARWAAAYSNIG
ncbi:MAG: substrate-binding domain-containing protein [bacterium]|nr:substrate-binding domain-containing protein [bacterium]